MVHITEMRVVMPMTTGEFRRAQRYANWKTNEYNTEEGQGGQLLASTPYVHEVWGEGFYSHSLYRLGDRIPDWVTRLIPSNALVIDEKTWMAYPYCRSVLTIPFFHKLKIEMVTMHVDDDGSSENIHGLRGEQLQIRKVDYVDISADKVSKRDYKAELDPAIFKSKRTGRGPLSSGWEKTAKPIMCAYKLVTVEANYWGVQSRAEKLMLSGVRQIVLLTHRNAFCYIDNWFDLTYEEISAMEMRGREKLKAIVKQPSIIDPTTGKELVLEVNNLELSSIGGPDESDESDIEVEFFEAEMDWATQEDEEYVNGLMGGLQIPDLLNQLTEMPDICAICIARSREGETPEVFCLTCNEHFCGSCFSDMHITSRLKSHTTRRLAPRTCVSDKTRSEGPSLHIQGDNPGGLDTTGPVATAFETPCLVNAVCATEDAERLKSTDSAAVQQGQVVGDPESTVGDGLKLVPRTKGRMKSGFRALNIWSSENDEAGLVDTSIQGMELKRFQGHPCNLSEEMVRCMSTLYMRCAESMSTSLASPVKRKKWRRSSYETMAESATDSRGGDDGSIDFYGTKNEHAVWSVDVYLNVVEVFSAPVEDKLQEFGVLYKKYRALVSLLAHVDPSQLTHEGRLAFWMNVYNSLVMHSYIVYGIPRSQYKRITMLNKAAYVVGGHHFSAFDVEHTILRANSYRPALVSLLSLHRSKKKDERLCYAVEQAEPLLSFGLCCGSRSSPMVRVYTAENVREELRLACEEFLVASVSVNSKAHRIYVPKILHWYARDFSHDAKSLLEWMSEGLPEDKRRIVKESIQPKRSKKEALRMSVNSYDWSFRYLFQRSLHIQP